MPTDKELTELATLDPGVPVLSVYLQIDPRDPANTHSTPRWRVALHSGLRDAQRQADESGDREARLALRDLARRIEDDVVGYVGQDRRGRGLAWFRTPDDRLDRRYTLQVPLRRDAVIWDRRPHVLPLIDAADRGRPLGLVLADGDHVRLLGWEMGKLHEPERSLYRFELTGEWHQYRGPVSPRAGKMQQSVNQREQYEQRVDAQRERFFAEAAQATRQRLQELGWTRIVVAGEPPIAERFCEALPADVRELVVSRLDLNLVHEGHGEILERVEPVVRELGDREAREVIRAAREHAAAGGAGTVGPDATLAALAEGRVAHLVLDPEADFSQAALGQIAKQVLGDCEPRALAERAVEQALSTDARVTLVDGDGLAEEGGIAALLRY